jgi:hypothetical protein
MSQSLDQLLMIGVMMMMMMMERLLLRIGPRKIIVMVWEFKSGREDER